MFKLLPGNNSRQYFPTIVQLHSIGCIRLQPEPAVFFSILLVRITMRILTLNIHKGFSWGNRRFVLHQVREAIRSCEADIVFLQEVVGENRKHAKKHPAWPGEAQHEFLADSVWSSFAYGKNAVYPHGHHGNAILSRFPILHSEQVDISTNRLEQRGFLFSSIGIPGSQFPLQCLCIHLGLFAVSRRKQLRMLGDYIGRNVPPHAPIIVAGDFNDWNGKSVIDFIDSSAMTDAVETIEGRKARTFPVRMPLLPLDRIYTSGIRINSSTTYDRGVWKKLSDHAALLIEGEVIHLGEN